MDWIASKLLSGAALIGCAVLAFLLFVQTAALTKANAKVAATELALQTEKTGRADDRRLTAEAHATALKTLRTEQQTITDRYQGALNAALKQADVHRRDRDAARAESDGLREQSMSAARQLADAATPASAVREYAIAANELLDNCQQSYQELASKADGHSADVQTLIAAWPVIGNTTPLGMR